MIEAVFLIILALLTIAVSIYFYIDVTKHKEDNISDFDKVKKAIKDEKDARTTNFNSIVNQVNQANTAHTNAIKNVDDSIDSLTSKYNSFETGFGLIIETANKTTGEPVALTATTTSTPLDIRFMKHVSAIGGMSLDGLNAETQFKACGTGADSNRCIELPNKAGHTYLTGLTSTGEVIVDAPLKTKNIDIMGDLKLYDSTNTQQMNISSADNVLVMNTPSRLKVNAPNGIEIPSIIAMRNETGTDIATITLNGDELSITSKKIKLRGDVSIDGKLTEAQ